MKMFKQICMRTLAPASALVLAAIIAVAPTGCRSSTADSTEFLEGDFTIPQIKTFEVLSANSMTIGFSKSVSVQEAEISCNNQKFSSTNAGYSSDRKTVTLSLDNKTTVGKNYVVEGQIKDDTGNTLTFSIPFCGYNENPASILLSEIRNAYGTVSVNTEKVHKSEFAEVYVTKGGNLAGLEIVSANDGDELKYSFPAIEVKSGEFITVHMRTIDAEGIDGEGMESELGEDLTLSTHIDSCDTARDLWSSNKKSCFGDSDIIAIRNSANGKIMDAVAFAKSELEEWKLSFEDLALAIDEAQVWPNIMDVSEAICSDNITSAATTRSISRQDWTTNGKDAWLVTADSGSGTKKTIGVTPGYENSSNAYSK